MTVFCGELLENGEIQWGLLLWHTKKLAKEGLNEAKKKARSGTSPQNLLNFIFDAKLHFALLALLRYSHL